MADFGMAFGGDFADSYMKGMQLAMGIQKQQESQKLAEQAFEMNKMYKEEQVLNLREKRTALDNAIQLRQRIAPMLQPTQVPGETRNAIPSWEDYAGRSEAVPFEPTQTFTTPSTMTGPSLIAKAFGPGTALAMQFSPEPEKVLSQVLLKQTETPAKTLENVLAEKVAKGEMTLQEALAAKAQETKQGSPTNPMMTDKGFTVAFNPGKGIWTATDPSGVVVPYDPQLHGAAQRVAEPTPKNMQPYSAPDGRTVLVDTSKSDAQKIIDSQHLKPLQEKTANIRMEGFGNIREFPVIDTKNNNSLQYLNANDINAANKNEPGRYVPAGEGRQALNKTALIEDIRGNIQMTRDSIKNLKTEFTSSQRAAIAYVLKSSDVRSAATAFLQGTVANSLTPEQADYVTNIFQLIENGMAMRSVLGAGQGSDELRAAIRATIPGAATPNKAWADMQLNKFEAVINRLSRGVPNVPLKKIPGQGGTVTPPPTGTPRPLPKF